MSKFLASFSLAICLLAPAAALNAQDHRDDAPKHVWSDNENPMWHQYLKEMHRKDHDWSKATKREQAAYWKWRDQHHDH
jgi:hypothetical protein